MTRREREHRRRVPTLDNGTPRAHQNAPSRHSISMYLQSPIPSACFGSKSEGIIQARRIVTGVSKCSSDSLPICYFTSYFFIILSHILSKVQLAKMYKYSTEIVMYEQPSQYEFSTRSLLHRESSTTHLSNRPIRQRLVKRVAVDKVRHRHSRLAHASSGYGPCHCPLNRTQSFYHTLL
jgi:hypothetical protein